MLDTENYRTDSEAQDRKKWIRIIAMVIVLFLILVYHILLGYTAHRQFDLLQTDARRVWDAAESWQAEGHTLSTCSEECEKAEFSKYIDQSGYYAIICDEQGNLKYTLYSHRKIKNLSQPDQIEEYRKINTIFRWYAVGSYPPEGNSPFT